MIPTKWIILNHTFLSTSTTRILTRKRTKTTTTTTTAASTISDVVTKRMRGGGSGRGRYWNTTKNSTTTSSYMNKRQQLKCNHEMIRFESYFVGSQGVISRNNRWQTLATTTTISNNNNRQIWKCNSIFNTTNNYQKWTTNNNYQSICSYSSTSFLQLVSDSTKNKNTNSMIQYGLPYTISPDDALEKFLLWAKKEQGLHWMLFNPKNVIVTAVYTPVWTYTLNVRYVLIAPSTASSSSSSSSVRKKRLDWKPTIFEEAYGIQQSVLHIPGLSSYAGYDYNRSFIDPIHNTTLLFLNEKELVPFGGWMMNDMQFMNYERTQNTSPTLQVSPDPWNASRQHAFSTIKSYLHSLGESADNIPTIVTTSSNNTSPNSVPYSVEVQTEVVSYKRVYLPTYVFTYQIYPNVTFQAFVSGCDIGSDVSGVSHQIFSDDDTNQVTNYFWNTATRAAGTTTNVSRILGLTSRDIGTLVMIGLQLLGTFFVRILARIPLLSLLGGIFVTIRKVFQPWYDQRSGKVQWEKQRQQEKQQQQYNNVNTTTTTGTSTNDDFMDSGTAQRYFYNNRDRILHTMSGRGGSTHANEYENQQQHGRGTYDWYQQWEKWARQQWNEQQQSQQSNTYQNQQRQRQQQQSSSSSSYGRASKQRPSTEYKWDFDPSDPYSVLGIRRGANKKEISAAFRKQMMLHHPDMHSNSSEAAKTRAAERSKLISEAYRTLKTTVK